VGGAVGNTIKLRTPIFAGPVNLALSCVFYHAGPNPMTLVLDKLLEPFRRFQDKRAKSLSERGRRVLEKEVAKLEAAEAKANAQEVQGDDPSAMAGPDLRILKRPLRPYVLIDDLQPRELSRILESSLDGAVTIVCREPALNDLLSAGSEAAIVWTLLHNGFTGRSYQIPGLGKKPGASIVQPALPTFLIAGPANLGRLFDSQDPLIRQFAAHLVHFQSTEAAISTPDYSGAEAGVNGLLNLISELLELRETGTEFSIELSQGAGRVLIEFSHQKLARMRAAHLSGPERFSQHAPLVAAKIAGSFQLISGQLAQPLPEAVMVTSIHMADKWCAASAELAALLLRQHDEQELVHRAEKMAAFSAEMGKASKWALFKKFDHHPKELMEPALELLIRTKRVRLVNGYVEHIES
jgi:hypothetical protein